MTELLTNLTYMINDYIFHVEYSVKKFNELIEKRHQHAIFGKGSLKILKDLLILENINSTNLSRLRKFKSKISQNGKLKIANNSEKLELQALIIKSSTSLSLVSNLLEYDDKKIVNLVENTMKEINSFSLLSAS